MQVNARVADKCQGWLLTNNRWHPSYSLLTIAWKELEPWLEMSFCPLILSAFISHSPQLHVWATILHSTSPPHIVCIVNVKEFNSKRWSKQILNSSESKVHLLVLKCSLLYLFYNLINPFNLVIYKEFKNLIRVFQDIASDMTTWIELKNNFLFSKIMFFHDTSFWKGKRMAYILKTHCAIDVPLLYTKGISWEHLKHNTVLKS